MDKRIPYIGNSAYCYANSTSMLLGSIGENIPPSIIEVLSGVGLGAFILKGTNLLFFSWNTPDVGIDGALKILGFEVNAKRFSKKNPCPLEELKKDLSSSPVVVGPLDMGYLNYNSRHQGLFGADHFILVYGVDDEKVYLHDSAGFPCVSLQIKQLRLAWSNDVGYSREHYRYWVNPRRIAKPSEEVIFEEAIKLFQSLYHSCEKASKEEKWTVGKEAILTTIQRSKDKKLSQLEINHLTYFALPLGAKRALDFSAFFEPYDKTLAELKQKQTVLFSESHSALMQKEWKNFEKSLEKLSVIEEEFKDHISEKI